MMNSYRPGQIGLGLEDGPPLLGGCFGTGNNGWGENTCTCWVFGLCKGLYPQYVMSTNVLIPI